MNIPDILKRISIEASEEEYIDFENRVVRKLWTEYSDECMEQATIIKNKVESYNISFPNGTVNKEYIVSVNIPMDCIDDYWFEGLDDIGLKEEIFEDNCAVKGMPLKAGSYDFKLCYKYKGWVAGRPVLERSFTIAINPDPRSLWKDIPTPKDIEYYKEDYDSAYVQVGDGLDNLQKDIVAASKRGRSHAHEGKARDDDFRLYHCDNTGWYIVTVADGAGSARYSREGSRIACETVINHCKEKLTDANAFEKYIRIFKEQETPENRKCVGDNIYDVVGNAAFKAHKAINEEAGKKGVSPKDYSTTLLLAICKKFDFGWFVASFWVGDGAMCIYDKERQYFKLLGTPDGGEYAGQTRFLTMSEIFSDPKSFYSRLKFSIEDDFTALILMSDGISDPMFETDANLNKIEKWNELWDDINKEVELKDNNLESQHQLLKWLDFWSAGNHDDRTIAILY